MTWNPSISNLSLILHDVDRRTAWALGKYYEWLGQHFLNIAADKDEQEAINERRRRRQAEIRAAADNIEEMMAAGLTLEQAADSVGARLLCDPGGLIEMYRRGKRRGKRRAQITRNVKIMQLAGKGIAPKDIGSKVGLSADRVERIIKQMIAAGRDLESLGQRFRHLRSNHRPAANSDQTPAPAELRTGTGG